MASSLSAICPAGYTGYALAGSSAPVTAAAGGPSINEGGSRADTDATAPTERQPTANRT